MRFYTFGNYYLSSLQQGLQGTHVLGEFVAHVKNGTPAHKTLIDWAKNHKTMVMLNGGNSADLLDIYARLVSLRKRGMKLPFAVFHEDGPSLNGAATCVGVIVPEPIYKLASTLRSNPFPEEVKHITHGFSAWEIQLAEELNKYPLAK